MSLDHVEGVGGNREVPPRSILAAHGDLRAVWGEASPEEGGTRRKHGFPRGSAPRARDVIEAYLGKQAVEGAS